MTGPFVLVHSPLVGPVTWRWVAQELERRGQRVVVPSLKAAAAAGTWQDCVEAALRDAPGEPAVLVGHSGAGPLLPVIASRMPRPPRRLVFVDAGVPPATGDVPLMPEEFLDPLRALARDGVLPPWSEWFHRAAMEELVPDPGRRAAVTADLPRLRVSYFDGRVRVPDGWEALGGAYVLLSEPYRDDAARAGSYGWPVRQLPGAHLDMVTRPVEVSDALLEVVET